MSKVRGIAAVLVLLCLGYVGAQFDYTSALQKSTLFFEAQRSGRLPASNRISWRGDSFLTDAEGIDLEGGYFDAGDQMKYGFPLGHSLIYLAWSMIDYRDAYVAAGELQNGLDSVRWGTDWLLKATQLGSDTVYAQVGDSATDHAYWGRPEEFPASGFRPALRLSSSRPGTDLAANYASALAVASVLFRDSDPTYAATCLATARQLYDFADRYRGIYTDIITDAAEYYESDGFEDELTFAAAMMALATDEQTYKTAAASFWTEFGLGPVEPFFDWGHKHAGTAVLLSRILGDSKYQTSAQAHCDHWVNVQPKTPKGLVFIDSYGSLGHAMNAAFGCLLVADSGIGNAAAYRAFAKQQMDYALGSTGRSFVVGYGVNPPTHVSHPAASCPNRPAPCDESYFTTPNPNGQVINGGLVGGPDEMDNYVDTRDNELQNEVALDYNAGFQAALAGLLQSQLRGQL